MYTKEMLFSTGRHWEEKKGVLTTDEMKERLTKTKSIYVISTVGFDKDNVFFFTDDYSFAHNVLPKCFVPSSTQIPMHVKERECLPDGWVDSVEKYIMIFENDHKQLSSIEELLEFLNKKEEFINFNYNSEN